MQNHLIQDKFIKIVISENGIIHALVIHATVMVMLVAWNAMVPCCWHRYWIWIHWQLVFIYIQWIGIICIYGWIQPVLMDKFNYKSLYIGFGSGMLGHFDIVSIDYTYSRYK